ncbi:MAG: PilZ domain-containing protein [Acidobacteria bacterium]|nr:PilZ domain-containing protein [Acidobacteriota bacterium]MBS1866607.1 PilZ domain-containing protein [Acidobacteriota bacterium]
MPMQVSGRDNRGVIFTEDTSCENLCRGGAAFLTRFEVAIGSDLEIRIPRAQMIARRTEPDFSTRGRVVHIAEAAGGRLVGVQFTGPRFQRMFRSESAA